MDEDVKVPSNDLRTLAETVDLRIPAKTGQFEIFTTPESGGAVPGPTDYATLVAELDASSGGQQATGTGTPNVWLVSNASRPWLSENFRAFLKRYAGDKFPSGAPGCSVITVKLVKSNQETHGFQCIKDAKMLVYVPLMV